MSEVEQIDLRIHVARQRHGRLSNDVAPVFSLPPEILLRIIWTCKDMSNSESNETGRPPWPAEVVFSHVSQYLRDLLLSTPLLWTDIWAKAGIKKDASNKVDKLHTHLSRSQPCMFKARLTMDGVHALDGFLPLLTQHMDRCQKLLVNIANTMHAVETLRLHFGHLTAPKMEALHLHVAFSPAYDHGRSLFPGINSCVFKGGAPLLTEARITGVSGPLRPPLQNLTVFNLDGDEMDDITMAQYRDLLSAMPQLEHLSLKNVEVIPDRYLEPSTVDLPQLRSLRVSGMMERTPRSLILHPLPTENLRTLICKETESLSPYLFPNVHTLFLDSCSFSNEELMHFNQSLSNLQVLHCDFSTPLILIMLGWTPDDVSQAPVLFPKLHSLSVTDMNQSDAQYFVEMVYSRHQNHRKSPPFQRLFMDRRCRKVLRDKDMLDRLHGIIDVEEYYDAEPWPVGFGTEDLYDSFWG